MANFLELVNGLAGHSDDTPGHEFPHSEHDNFFADRDTAASAHHQHSLPSFPEAFGGSNDCHRQPIPPAFQCPLHGDFLQQQYRQTGLPLSPSPANTDVPRALNHGAADLAPLHLGRNTISSSSDNHNNNSPCQTREADALQWPDGAFAARPFSCLSHAPLHLQRQHQQHQHQHQHQPFDTHPLNPHPSIASHVGGQDLDGLNWDLHHPRHCTTQQPPSTSQAPLPRPALSPTTTASSHEHAPFSSQRPFPTPEQTHLLHLPIYLPRLQSQPHPHQQLALSGDYLADTLQAQIPGADFDHFSAPYGNDHHPFPFWHPSMTSAPRLSPNSFGPETAMPSLANPPSARRRSSRRLSNSVVDLTKEESRENLTSSSPVPMAPPPSRKRRRSTTAGGGTSASNPRRTSASHASKAIKTEAKRPGSRGGDTCVFGSSPPPAFHSDEDVLDLTEVNEVTTDQKKIEADRRVKLSKFQCVICMDDVSNLTVTHCGHLFCSECLHSALHIDSTKKSCPVCRTKVDLRSKTGKNTKSYYHLELKVMTATRKGKQPAAATR